MKKKLLFGCFMSISLAMGAQTLNRSVLIDFSPTTEAPNDSSKITTNPDSKGNYWNNATNLNNTASSAALALFDKTNAPTGIFYKTVTDFSVNATPGAAGLRNLSQLNVASLGDMAVTSATTDYYFTTATGSLKFSGLSPCKAYMFYVFGSRSATDDRITKYTFTGATTTMGTLQTSGTNLGGTYINANNGTTYNSPLLYSDANGEIKIDVTSTVSGGFAYVNAVRVEEYTIPAANVITVTGSDINTAYGILQMSATLPSNATTQTIVWTVSDPQIATINASGLLSAHKNGTVTVTATTKEVNSTTFGSVQVAVSNQPVPLKEYYLDFGPNDGINGDLTPTAWSDVYGNYWNNASANMPNGITPVPSTLVSNMVDKLNAQSAISVTVNNGLFTNGKLNGALLVPNTNYLGELGIATATEDYFSTASNGTMTFGGLNINKGYRFRIFGARDNTQTRTSRYSFTGSNTVTGTLQTSGTNLGGTGVNNNNSGIYVSDLVYPNSLGVITLYVDIAVSSFAYINVMKIEEFNVAVESIDVTSADITTNGGTSQILATVSPTNATVKTVTWSVDNTAIATIDATGLLKAVSNGAVNVTATSTEASSTVSKTIAVNISGQISTDVPNVANAVVVYRNASNEIVVTGAHGLLELYSADGRKVLTQNPYINNVINVTGFSKGIYMLTVDKAKTTKIAL